MRQASCPREEEVETWSSTTCTGSLFHPRQHNATLAKFGTRRPLLDGEPLFQAGDRDHRPDYSDHSYEMVVAVNEILRPMAGI